MGKASFVPQVNAFRFYENGTESGSNQIAAQDTNISRNVDSDSQIHLRYRIDETGGAGGAATDDYALEYSFGGGGFVAVGAASTYVISDNTSGLSDGVATTNRAVDPISDPGAGSFVAGEQEESNGIVEDHELTASNFTEHVWALKLISADLADTNTLDFRVTYNGGSPGITNNVTPRITVVKTGGAARRIFVIT